MRPFDHYKRLRNKVAELGCLDSFQVIWAYDNP
jgi:hypothetical protein